MELEMVDAGFSLPVPPEDGGQSDSSNKNRQICLAVGLTVPVIAVLIFAAYIAKEDANSFISTAIQCCLGQWRRFPSTRVHPLNDSNHVSNAENRVPSLPVPPPPWPQKAKEHVIVVVHPDKTCQIADKKLSKKYETLSNLSTDWMWSFIPAYIYHCDISDSEDSIPSHGSLQQQPGNPSTLQQENV